MGVPALGVSIMQMPSSMEISGASKKIILFVLVILTQLQTLQALVLMTLQAPAMPVKSSLLTHGMRNFGNGWQVHQAILRKMRVLCFGIIKK
jgi:hypothetical protein